MKLQFRSEGPNVVLAGDIKTKIGWLYLAGFMDLSNREVIAYSTNQSIDTDLEIQALGKQSEVSET